MLTFYEICEKLQRLDEISLLEALEISSEDIIQRFEDRIEERFEAFREDFDEDASDDG